MYRLDSLSIIVNAHSVYHCLKFNLNASSIIGIWNRSPFVPTPAHFQAKPSHLCVLDLRQNVCGRC